MHSTLTVKGRLHLAGFLTLKMLQMAGFLCTWHQAVRSVSYQSRDKLHQPQTSELLAKGSIKYCICKFDACLSVHHSITLHREGKLILEQCPGNPNPLFELAIHPAHTPHDRVSCTTSLIPDT